MGELRFNPLGFSFDTEPPPNQCSSYWKITFGSQRLPSCELEPKLCLMWLLLQTVLGKGRFAWAFHAWLMPCAVPAFRSSACSYSCRGLGWGQMAQWGWSGALSKCPRSPSGLVLSVHKTQDAIIYRGVYCKYYESKEMRKKKHVNNKTLVTCVIPTIAYIIAYQIVFVLAYNSI